MTNEKTEIRYIREIIYGKKREIRYWQVKELKELEVAPNSKRNSRRKLKFQEVTKHPHWDRGKGWKDHLNNLRLFLQPLACFNILKPWLVVLFSPRRIRAFAHLFFGLIRAINSLLETIFPSNSYFSSA
jgi:hypothetical protein